MLKITTENGSGDVTLKLEGKLAGLWVDELERTWYGIETPNGLQALTVDLSGVTYIDSEGKKLLAWFHERGAKLHAAGCLTKSIVESIKNSTQIEPRKGCDF